MMGSFSNGPFILLCLLVAGSAEEYSTEEKLKYKFCKNYVQIGHLTGDLKPMTFWYVDCHDQAYFSVGDIAIQSTHAPHKGAILVKDENNGLLERPKGFREIWRSPGSNKFTVFEMGCEHGFKALGNVVVKGSNQFPDLHSYSIHVWTFIFGNNHNIHAKTVYALNQNKVMSGEHASVQFKKASDTVCGGFGPTKPTGSPYTTLIPWPLVSSGPITSDPSTFCNDKPDGIYAYPADAHKYYICSNRHIVFMNCPEGLVYNATKDMHDWPSDSIVDEFCKDKPNGHYSYPPDPEKYYACLSGNTQLKNCPQGHIFINFERQCSWPRRGL